MSDLVAPTQAGFATVAIWVVAALVAYAMVMSVSETVDLGLAAVIVSLGAVALTFGASLARRSLHRGARS